MKILITSLNSKFIHLNLAIRYLKKYLMVSDKINVSIEEFTINQSNDFIVKKIIMSKIDVVAFSVYIWNVEKTLEIISVIKKINKNITIIVGGPEVSYDSFGVLEKNSEIDFVVMGEGEIAFNLLIQSIFKGKEFKNIEGIAYRNNNKIVVNQKSPLLDISDLIFPYDLPFDKNKMIYYETSRGCPYNCSYCISSTIKGVRYKNIHLVKKDLKLFLDNNVKIVKFVDRTFNVDKIRSLEIIKYIIDNDNGVSTFHFELSPNLIDDDWIKMLEGIRNDFIQFEIGIQSIHSETLKAVNRSVVYLDVKNKIKKVTSLENVHVHLDLIAGLPYENYTKFMESFDQVYSLKADHFQLGFLKILKGSKIRTQSDKFGYIYNNKAPYEIILNDFVNYNDILKLKDIEQLLEDYYNSHHFEYTLKYIVTKFEKPSVFYEEFSNYWNEKELYDEKHKLINLFIILFEFVNKVDLIELNLIKDLMKMDYYRKKRYKEKEFFGEDSMGISKNDFHKFLQNKDNIKKYMPQFINYRAKDIMKYVDFFPFDYDIISDGYKKEKNTIYFDYKHNKFGKIMIGDMYE